MTHTQQSAQAEIDTVAASIQTLDSHHFTEARAHLDQLTKPLGALGRLEDVAAQLYAIRRGNLRTPLAKAVYVIAADHGIAAEGVSAYPSEVTRQMVLNFLSGGAAINVLARLHHVGVRVVDVGVGTEFTPAAGLISAKVRAGSRNMLHEPALSWDELAAALHAGFSLAEQAAAEGVHVLAPGEMGIGNTTAASALTAALTGAPTNVVTGRGTGVTPEAFAHKQTIVQRVVAKHLAETTGTLDTFRRMGGLELAAITGLVLGAAEHGIAVVADGFISTAAIAYAVELAPATRPYLFAGHRSHEPGHRLLLEHLGLEPLLDLGMRLGEGTGAVLAMPLLDAAQHIYTDMATFASAGVSGASA